MRHILRLVNPGALQDLPLRDNGIISNVESNHNALGF